MNILERRSEQAKHSIAFLNDRYEDQHVQEDRHAAELLVKYKELLDSIQELFAALALS